MGQASVFGILISFLIATSIFYFGWFNLFRFLYYKIVRKPRPPKNKPLFLTLSIIIGILAAYAEFGNQQKERANKNSHGQFNSPVEGK